ncbi:MAG: endospore germination permease [Clostridia bacterium]|nr:endospore germination permease [Clostridia bacterium]
MGTIREGHIGYREAVALLAIMLITKVFLTCPSNISDLGGTAGWLVVLVYLLVAVVAVLPGLALLKRYPDRTLIEVAEEFGGAITGILVALLLFGYFLLSTVIIMRQFTETVIVALLPTTPISLITVFFLLGMLYPCYQGIESLTRGAWLLMPFFALGLFGVLALVLPWANPDYLFPFWGPGLPAILKAGPMKSSMLGEILLVTLLNPYLRDRQKVTAVVMSSLIISGLIFTLTVLVYQMVFPYPASGTEITYPMYNLARLIYFGRFVQRVESIFIFIWVFSLLVNVSALFYGTTVSLARGLNLPFYRPLLFPVAVLIYSLNFLILNFPTAAWLDAEVLHNYGWIIAFGLPALVWLLAKLRDKGGGSHGIHPQNNG